MKIQALPGQYLHFCGLRTFIYDGEEILEEEVEDEPEPPEPVVSTNGTTVVPEPVPVFSEWITMSSYWKDERMKPWNVIKTKNFNANWGQGEFTCVHSLADEDGPWWRY